MSVITLLTDFGTDDEYVGLMKGVILSINPRATIVDLTHQISPQDIVQAAFTIDAGYHYFPEGTVHLIVVVQADDEQAEPFHCSGQRCAHAPAR